MPAPEEIITEKTETAPVEQPHEPTQGEPEATFTQEQVNSMVGKARTSEREKHAEEIRQLKEGNETYQRELEELRAANSALLSEKQHAEWRSQAAKEAGVPSALVKGETLEEMQEHAQLLHEALVTASMSNAPKYPVVNEGSAPKAAAMSKVDILAIEDAKARKQAILENLDLF